MVEMIQLANGKEVPKSCVDAFDEFERIWQGASLQQARVDAARAESSRLGLVFAVVDALPFEIQTRVRYIFDSGLGPEWYSVHTLRSDGWIDGTPEGAAAYPWLMQNCIAWVEERQVYKSPWEPIGEDDYTDG